METNRANLQNMSVNDYIKYLEDNYLSSSVPKLGDMPWRVIGVLINAIKLGLKPGQSEDMEMYRKASSPLAIADVFKCNLKAIIRSLPQDKGTSRLERIPITCIPQLRSPNAQAALTPRGDPYILVDSGLSYCLHSMTKALTHRMQTSASQDKPLSRAEIKAFLASVARYLKSGNASALSFASLRMDTSILMLQSLLPHGQLIFLIWHELVHHMVGHVGKSRNVKLNTTPPVDITLVSREQNQELVADIIGAKFAYHTFQFYANPEEASAANVPVTFAPQVYAVPDIFFTFLNAFERLLGRSWSPTDSHPSGAMRRSAIRKKWNDQLPTEAVQFGNAVERIFEELLGCGDEKFG